MSSDEMNPEDERLLAEFGDLLADPSTWAEPDAEVEDRLVAAVSDEVHGRSTSVYHAVAPRSRARRWLGAAGAAAVGAAAAVAITLVATRDSSPSPAATVAMTGTDLAPGIAGSADLTEVASGVKIELKVPGLPRRDGGEFYQVWLKSCDGTQLVPAGSFHELDDAVAWAGVSTDDFPLLTVTREVVAPPKDAAQGSSGEVVAAGALRECPA